jgi:hypothetical protein
MTMTMPRPSHFCGPCAERCHPMARSSSEAMSGVRGAEPLDAYYGFYTLAMGRGEPRTVAEIGRLLRQAGFGRFRLLRNRMPILTSILVARWTSS